MADTTLELNTGSGGNTVAVDNDVTTGDHQYVKLKFGPSGTQTHVTAAAGLPVTPDSGGFAVTATLDAETTKIIGTVNMAAGQSIAATQSGTWNLTNISGTISLPTGAATESTLSTLNTKFTSGTVIGAVEITDTSFAVADGNALGEGVLIQGDDGTDRKNINVDATTGDVQVDVTNTVTVGPHDVTNAGTFVTQVDGAALTALQLIDDAYVAQGTALGSTKNALIGGSVTTAAPTYTTGQISPLSLDTSGALRVTGSSGSTQYVEDTQHNTGDTGTMSLAVRNDTLAALAGTDGDYAPLQVNASGALYVAAEAGSAEVTLGTDTYTEATSAGVIMAGVRNDTLATLANADNEFAPFQFDALGALWSHIQGMTTPNGDSMIDDTNDALQVNIVAGSSSGTEYTEDAAAPANPAGGAVMLVRDDTPGALTSLDGDIVAQRGTNYGAGFVQVVDSSGNFVDTFGGSGGTAAADDADFTAGTTQGTLVQGVYESSPTSVTDGDMGAIGIDANRQVKVVEASAAAILADTASMDTNLGTIAGAVNAGQMQVDIVADGADLLTNTNFAAAFGTAGTADAQVMSVQGIASMTPILVDATGQGDVPITLGGEAVVLGAGSASIGTLGANSGVDIGDVDVLSLPNVTLAAGTNTNEVVGDAAHDAAVAGNPLLQGIESRTTEPTAVGDGDAVRVMGTSLGKQVNYPYAIPAKSWTYASAAAVTDTADDAAKTAAGAGVRNYVTGIQVFNGHDTTGTEVVIKDGSTVIWRGWAEQTGGGCSAKFDPPLRGTANTAVNVANITTSSSTYFNLQGFESAE